MLFASFDVVCDTGRSCQLRCDMRSLLAMTLRPATLRPWTGAVGSTGAPERGGGSKKLYPCHRCAT